MATTIFLVCSEEYDVYYDIHDAFFSEEEAETAAKNLAEQYIQQSIEGMQKFYGYDLEKAISTVVPQRFYVRSQEVK